MQLEGLDEFIGNCLFFDRAKVLLLVVSCVSRERFLPKEKPKVGDPVKKLLTNNLWLVCTQYIVAAIEHKDANAKNIPPIVQNLHSLLKHKANFFAPYRKRWHEMCRVASGLG